MIKQFNAWAINTNEGHGFLGRYYFGYQIPKHMEGCVSALFKTRKEAREALAETQKGYTPFPRACVSRVKVTITEIRQD